MFWFWFKNMVMGLAVNPKTEKVSYGILMLSAYACLICLFLLFITSGIQIIIFREIKFIPEIIYGNATLIKLHNLLFEPVFNFSIFTLSLSFLLAFGKFIIEKIISNIANKEFVKNFGTYNADCKKNIELVCNVLKKLANQIHNSPKDALHLKVWAEKQVFYYLRTVAELATDHQFKSKISDWVA